MVYVTKSTQTSRLLLIRNEQYLWGRGEQKREREEWVKMAGGLLHNLKLLVLLKKPILSLPAFTKVCYSHNGLPVGAGSVGLSVWVELGGRG